MAQIILHPVHHVNAKATRSGPMEQQAKSRVEVDGKAVDLPIKKATLGGDVIDIRTLQAETGLLSFDPGVTLYLNSRIRLHKFQ
jgi:hypothetical protein